MRLSFSQSLLITLAFVVVSCKTQYIPGNIKFQNHYITDSLVTLDSNLVKSYLPYKAILENDMNRVISVAETEMDKDKPESRLTNFLADLILNSAVKELEKQGQNELSVISYLNYGGIRTFFPKGNITVGKVFELMPFENELVLVEFSGYQVQQFLDILAEKGGDCVGGVTFVISENKAKNIKIGGKKLLLEEKYRVATSDYVANGGDGLGLFLQKTDLINTGKKIRDIIIASLEEKHKKGETLRVETDGRIRNE